MVVLPKQCYSSQRIFTKYLLSAITIELFKYRNYHEYLNQHKVLLARHFILTKT